METLSSLPALDQLEQMPAEGHVIVTVVELRRLLRELRRFDEWRANVRGLHSLAKVLIEDFE